MANGDGVAILTCREVTKHSPQSVRTSRHVLGWDNMPRPFKVYPMLPASPKVDTRDLIEAKALLAELRG